MHQPSLIPLSGVSDMDQTASKYSIIVHTKKKIVT